MARIRSLKPGFCKSLDVAELPRVVRLHWAMLWTYADDEGRGLDHPSLINSELWPLDRDITDEVVESWQALLHAKGRIVRYRVDGRDYFEVVNWDEHQHPQKPVKSKYPPPSDGELRDPPRTPIAVLPDDDATSAVGLSPVVEGRGGDYLSSSSSDYNSAAVVDDDEDDVIHKATRLVALARLERREAERGPVGDAGAWLKTAQRNARPQVVETLGQLGPGTTAEHIVQKLAGKPNALDATAAAAEAKYARNEKPCENCGGMAVLETDEGCVPCPKCNGEAA